MRTPLTPNDIEVLLWCHCRPEPHERISAPAVTESLHMLISSGMIEQANSAFVFSTTNKGRAMVAALCRTPEPRCVWVDREGKALLTENKE